MNIRPRIALIGISGYARLVLQSLLAVLEGGAGELVAAVVINRAAEADVCEMLERRGCKIYDDYEWMLDAEAVDLCVIPTGIPWHEEMCVKAVSSGAHVLVEKPLAGDVGGGKRIIEAAIRYDRTVAVGFQNMYCPQVQAIKKYLLAGGIGEIHSIEAAGSWPRDRKYYTRNMWAGRAMASGRVVNDSLLNNAFSHMANLSLFFAGKTFGDCANAKVEGGNLFRHLPIETFDSADVQLTTKEGVPIRWVFTHADRVTVNPTIRIEAEGGSLCWVNNGRATAADREGRVLEGWSVCLDEEARREMLRVMIFHAAGEAAPICDARFALAHGQIISEIVRMLPVQVIDVAWSFRDGVFEGLRKRNQIATA